MIYFSIIGITRDVGEDMFKAISNEAKQDPKSWQTLVNLEYHEYENLSARLDDLPKHLAKWRLKQMEIQASTTETDEKTDATSQCMMNEDLFVERRRLTDPIVETKNLNAMTLDQMKSDMTTSHLHSIMAKAKCLDPLFQSEVSAFVKTLSCKCEYIATSTKKFARSQEKTQINYSSKKYPTCMELTDVLRCTVVFESAADMLAANNAFKEMVESGKCGRIIMILRCKNGMKMAKHFTGAENSVYCDLKWNIVIVDEKKRDWNDWRSAIFVEINL